MNKHLFARICRVIGRFLLCVGTIFLTGSILLAAAPTLFGINDQSQAASNFSIENFFNPSSSCGSVTHIGATNPAYSALGVVIFIAVITIFGVVLHHYNDSIRKFIANIAKRLKISIHSTELLCSTFIWGMVTAVTLNYLPIFALLALTILIVNNLFFIFAWTSYGCRNYTL
jgi:hypothetical protein